MPRTVPCGHVPFLRRSLVLMTAGAAQGWTRGQVQPQAGGAAPLRVPRQHGALTSARLDFKRAAIFLRPSVLRVLATLVV